MHTVFLLTHESGEYSDHTYDVLGVFSTPRLAMREAARLYKWRAITWYSDDYTTPNYRDWHKPGVLMAEEIGTAYEATILRIEPHSLDRLGDVDLSALRQPWEQFYVERDYEFGRELRVGFLRRESGDRIEWGLEIVGRPVGSILPLDNGTWLVVGAGGFQFALRPTVNDARDWAKYHPRTLWAAHREQLPADADIQGDATMPDEEVEAAILRYATAHKLQSTDR